MVLETIIYPANKRKVRKGSTYEIQNISTHIMTSYISYCPFYLFFLLSTECVMVLSIVVVTRRWPTTRNM